MRAALMLGLAATGAAMLKGFDDQGGAGKRILVIPIENEIELGLAGYVERVLESAEAGDIVMLNVETFGGRVDAAVRIRDALLAATVPTVAFVRRAISAGALISLACDTLIMQPSASMGAATPVQQGEGGEMKATSEKVVSYMRAEMRATAEAKGRRADLAEAMVDQTIEIKDIIAKDKLLTVTGSQAVELGLADASAKSIDEAIALLNLGQATRSESHATWGEKIARVLTGSVVNSMLMTFGFLGLLMELYSPGWGVGGTIGAVCLVLAFLGQYAANLAGIEEFLLVGLGFALLALEVLIIPGFGIAGILGIGCVVGGIAMASVDLRVPWEVAMDAGLISAAAREVLLRLAVMTVCSILVLFVVGKYLPKHRFSPPCPRVGG
jgi:membrane-bound serine protease (ClpP class)